MRHHERGFTLLEVIIVLAIMGGALVMYTNHVRKESLKTAQQNVANALVLEMKGVINFLHDDPLPEPGSDSDEGIANPLYGDVKNIDEIDKYHTRLTNNINDINTGSVDRYFLWGDGNNSANQRRYLFISEKCDTQLKSQLNLSKEYLPCTLAGQAKNSSAIINRIGFAADNLEESGTTIARTDVIVAFAMSKGNERFHFADYATPFSKALNNSGLIASHMMIVHRSTANGDWQLMTKKDGKTPVELNNLASNMDVLAKFPASEYFGVRFTFDMNDNGNGGSGGGGGGANVCWDSQNSTVVHCFEQQDGTDDHGQDTALALTTKPKDDPDTKDPSKIKTGTLNANLIMENTSRRVYIFKRQQWGEIEMGSDGNPELYTWTDKNGDTFTGEYFQDDNRQGDYINRYQYGTAKSYYVPETYDAYELVTPAIVDYIANRSDKSYNVDGTYVEYNDGDNSSNIGGALRYPIQVCPKLTQQIALRDKNGNPNGEYTKVERHLFPRLSVSISSLSAYPGISGDTSGNTSGYSGVDLYELENNRVKLDDSVPVGQLGGITTQVEIAEQSIQQADNAGINTGEHYIYNNHKYVWAITNTLGIYDGKTGQGMNVLNSADVSYTVTRWCSTIPQTGTPADLISTYNYEAVE